MLFSQFPKTLYGFDFTSNSSVKTVTNIFTRFRFNDSVLNNALAFYKYQCEDLDTPEIISFKVYGDVKYHWIITMVNQLDDPLFNLPLPRDSFERKVVKQYNYPTIANAYSTIHHYVLEVKQTLSELEGPTTVTTSNTIVTLDQFDYTSNTITTNNINNPVTSNISFYANNSNANSGIVATLSTVSTYKPVYVYEHEEQLNERYREIKILKKQYIASVLLELENILNG
jgi:hypothetical protein